ncbi:MAG: copper-binding protein [Burkholderiales bacterium]|nr:copper-binding protein [Burkholderiales bacterium]
MNTIQRFATSATLLSALFTANAYAQATDPAAPAPPLRYESAFSDYRAQQDTPLLPWKTLFTAGADFADANTQTAPMEATARKAPLDIQAGMQTQLAQADNAPATASDTRGRIESINPSDGKVKLKHGPIPKFDMPGMTMVFRVQNPKLLTQIKVGDEVGVTLDKSGGSLVITGFQK